MGTTDRQPMNALRAPKTLALARAAGPLKRCCSTASSRTSLRKSPSAMGLEALKADIKTFKSQIDAETQTSPVTRLNSIITPQEPLVRRGLHTAQAVCGVLAGVAASC